MSSTRGIDRKAEKMGGRKRGPKPRASKQSQWMVKRLVKLCTKADAKLVRDAHEHGLNARDLGAMFTTLFAMLKERRDDMEPHHWFGTAIKLLDTGRKLLELQAIEASEVPGSMMIDVTGDPAAGAGDDIPIS